MSAAEARALFRAFLRLAKPGSYGTAYNVREYVKRRARAGFEEARGVTDKAALQRLWDEGRQQLEVARRQAVVYELYARRHKHAMELLRKQ